MLVVYSLRDCCRTRTVSIDLPQRNVISVLMMAAIKELKLPPPPPKYLLHLKGMRDDRLHDDMMGCAAITVVFLVI